MTSPTPPQIPGYSLQGLLGEGGMAEVWLATQESLQRKVALKVLRGGEDEALRRRFLREAHTVAALRHPAIITIHDVGELADGRLFLAMEFVAGGDLSQFRGQALPPAQVANWTRQIAQGLDVLHDQGLVHRDLKPANLLLRDAEQIVISDFGIARDPSIDSDLTQAGLVVGSPAYSSPEQAQCQPLDRRSDLYSLGVIVLELLTGRNVFRGDNYASTVSRHLYQPLPPLPDALAAWQPLLVGLLAKEPQQRLADGRAVCTALDLLLAQPTVPPVVAVPVSSHRQWRSLGLLVAGGGLLLLTLFAVWPWASRHYTIYQQLQQGEQALQAKQLGVAEQAFRQVLALESDNRAATDGLASVKQARINDWLARAEQSLLAQRYLEPADNNARDQFRQVLALAPHDSRALQGLQRLSRILGGLAEQALANQQRDTAQSWLQAALELAPQEARLLALQQQLQEAATVSKPKASKNSTPGKSKNSTPAAKPSPLKRFWHKLWG